MSFDSVSDLLHMGGHGLYVWLSYAIAAAVIAINILAPLSTRKQLLSELKRRLRREEKN